MATVEASQTLRDSLKAAGLDASCSSRVPIDTIAALSAHLQSTAPDATDSYVFSLIKGSRLHYTLQPQQRPPRSKELESRLQGIQNELDNQAYLEMTKGVQKGCSTDPSKIISSEQSGDSLGQELRAANAQLSAAINVFLSMAAVFTAAFYFGDQVTNDTGLKVLLALAGAWVVGIAEGYFFLKDLVMEEKGWTAS